MRHPSPPPLLPPSSSHHPEQVLGAGNSALNWWIRQIVWRPVTARRVAVNLADHLGVLNQLKSYIRSRQLPKHMGINSAPWPLRPTPYYSPSGSAKRLIRLYTVCCGASFAPRATRIKSSPLSWAATKARTGTLILPVRQAIPPPCLVCRTCRDECPNKEVIHFAHPPATVSNLMPNICCGRFVHATPEALISRTRLLESCLSGRAFNANRVKRSVST